MSVWFAPCRENPLVGSKRVSFFGTLIFALPNGVFKAFSMSSNALVWLLRCYLSALKTAFCIQVIGPFVETGGSYSTTPCSTSDER